MHVTSEAELLERFKKGDVQAFEEVFKSCYPLLKTEAWLLLEEDEEAEDQVQQLFIDIWNKALYKNIDVSIRAYLYRAIRHKCLNFLEKKRRQERMVSEYAQSAEEVDTETISEELPLHMHQVLQELPPQRLAAFNLVYLEEKSYKTAAGEMGISVNSLKTHLKMGLKFLRSSIQRAH